MSVIYCIVFIIFLLGTIQGGGEHLEIGEYFMIEWALFAIADIFLIRFLREVVNG